MNDRELLELAAKAAGIKLLKVEIYPNGFTEAVREGFNPNGGNIWNPLTDDGDALRLAVKLGMDVCFGASYVIVRGSVQSPIVNNANDPYAATRYAITRAAAEIERARITTEDGK